MDPRAPVALTIAGSDSGGGAGIQADLKTFAAFQVFGTSAITALTAQNTRGVTGVLPADAGFVRAQIEAVLADFDVGACKTGMLGTTENVRAVAELARARAIPLVVDPVLVATSGDALGDAGVAGAMKDVLFREATLVTPNVDEARALTGATVRTLDDLAAAGRALLSLGAKAVLMKGGHLQGRTVTDLLVTDDDVRAFTAPRLAVSSTHGTGCTLSAAICAGLARGAPLTDAVSAAHAYVHTAIARAPALPLRARDDGAPSHGPLHHLHPYYALPTTTRATVPPPESAPDDDARFMALALDEARAAATHGDVPVGAVVVVHEGSRRGEIVARGHNRREDAHDPTHHAELAALRDASRVLRRWRLSDCTLYVTLEPCFMCAGALVQARVGRVVVGARDPKAGALLSLASLASDPRLNHRFTVDDGVLGDACGAVLKQFFAERRT